MKYIIIFCLLANVAGAQINRNTYDFSKVNAAAIDPRKVREKIDSLREAIKLDSLTQLYYRAQFANYTPRYGSFILGFEMSTASLSTLNHGLGVLGLRESSENFAGVPFGFAFRGKRFMGTYVFTPSINKNTSNQDFKIKLSTIGFELNIGYDVVNAKRFQLYPQVGLLAQYFDINVLRKASVNDIQDPNDFVFKSSSIILSRGDIALSYGLEADYHLKYSEGGLGTILFARYGMTTGLIDGKFRIDNKKSAFDVADDRMKTSFVSVGLKFYGKMIH